MGLMARGNPKVSSDDSSFSDDDSYNDLSPRDLKLLLDEYNDIIKKLKSKLKCLKNVHVELKVSHEELLVRHNEVVETHEKMCYV
jgi:hypothetical protein